ncbi:velvet factor [Ceratobasidium sp. AG-Ba]|nr:velvet factor [Ceratobasidium sp. AG-Ba]
MSTSSGIYPRVHDMYIGKPIRYVSGPFAGRTIRSELSEYQKPDLGRKFAKRDRRPVDPPPVVRLQLFETKDAGTPNQREEELHADSVDVSGLVAHVDMFPVNPSEEMRRIESIESSQSSASLATTSNPQQISPINEAHYNHWTSDCVIDINEDSKLTTAVFGSSFVHAVQVLDMSGEHVILFVFADLSVKLEGQCFDLFGRVAGSEDVPIAAELFSGVFVIYSTKEFPGLQASTPLTKHLGRWGVRVNLRETSRRKKGKQGEGDEEEDGDSSGAGDAIVDEERETQFYSPNFLAPYTSQVGTSSRFTPVTFSAPTTYQEQHDQYGQGSPERQIQEPRER